MEKILNGILKTLAVLCAILFIVTIGIALVLFNAEKRLFNAQLYIHALQSQNFYERLPGLAAESLAASPNSNPSQDGARAYLDRLPAENWETIFRAVLPTEVSQPMTEQAITSVFDYLNGTSETASLSLVGFKSHLTGPAGTEALLAILRAQPACTLEQIAKMTIGNLLGQNAELVLCNPSDELLSFFQPILQGQIQAMASTIPDSVNLAPNAASVENPLTGLRAMRALMRFSPLIPFGLLFLITLLAVRDLQDWLDWWGIPMLLGGVFGILLATAIHPLFQWAFAKHIVTRIPAFLPVGITETVHDLTSTVLSGVAIPILLQSALLVLIGLIMVLALRFKKLVAPFLKTRQPQ
jgi:hypothetical protein